MVLPDQTGSRPAYIAAGGDLAGKLPRWQISGDKQLLTLLAKMFAVGYIGIASAIFIGYAVWLIITEAPFFLIGLIAGSGIGGAWLFVFMFGAKAYWEYWEEQSKKRSK